MFASVGVVLGLFAYIFGLNGDNIADKALSVCQSI